MPRESRVHIDDQIAAGAEFFQRQALQPRLAAASSTAVSSSPAACTPVRRKRYRRAPRAFPARSQLPEVRTMPPSQREENWRSAMPSGREFGIEDRVEKMQRTVDKFAGVHRQRAVLALPAAVAKGQVAQAQVEVGYRPVRSLQAGVGDVRGGQSAERGPWLTARKTRPARRGSAVESR